MTNDKDLDLLIQSMETPSADENARKRAVNLAVAEFKALENKQKNIFQGSSLLSRLTGRSTSQNGRTSMENRQRNKFIYGGMATAMAVVLIAGVSFTQLENLGGEHSVNELALASKAKQDEKIPETTTPTSQVAPPVAVEETVTIDDYDASVSNAVPQTLADTQAPAKAEAYKSAPMGRMEAAPMDMAARQSSMAERKMAAPGAVAAGGNPNYMPSPPIVAPEPMPPVYAPVENRDRFEAFEVNPVKLTAQEPVSTFSIDVDTASYSFVRKQLNYGSMPDKDSVRIEEMINYFDYNYPLAESREQPFKPTITVMPSPWAQGKQLVHVAIKGYDVKATQKPHSNLVFLIDVSGSMEEPDKLPLVKTSMKMLLDSLQPDDTVAIAVYAGAAGAALEPTKVSDRQTILNAIDNLQAGGSTAGAEGINLAYQMAEKNFKKEGVNRVILATDGDFNVGASSDEELKALIEKKRESGIFLSVLGFGQGNLNDQMMQTIAQNGNGTAAYIDTLNEARKVLVDEASSTLFPIAKDVKIQVEFNPGKIAEYRLIGYETRALNREDFNNDKVDAGDIGAGHAVTAIYEVTPVGSTARSIDDLRYGVANRAPAGQGRGEELGFVKVRYKLPTESTSKLIDTPIREGAGSVNDDVNFSVAVAGFGQLLKGSAYSGSWNYDDVVALAQKSKGRDEYGQRTEFINLVRLAKAAGGSAAPNTTLEE